MEGTEAGQAYNNQTAHVEVPDYLGSELRLLNMRLRHLISRRNFLDAEEPIGQLRGLVLTEAEVYGLLDEAPAGDGNDRGQEAVSLELSRLEEEINCKKESCMVKGIPLPLTYLSEAFGLDRFEEQCIIIALAAELDRKYEKLFAYVQDDINMKYPTVDLAIRLLAGNDRESFEFRRILSRDGRLFRHILEKKNESPGSWLSQPLKLDEGVIDYILNMGKASQYVSDYAHMIYPDGELQPLVLNQDVQDRMRNFIALQDGRRSVYGSSKGNTIFYLQGARGSGKKLQVKQLCRCFGLPALMVDASQMSRDEKTFMEQSGKVCREAILQQAVLCFDNFEALTEGEEEEHNRKGYMLIEAAMEFSGLLFILSGRAWKPVRILDKYRLIGIELETPRDFERKRLWEYFAKRYEFDTEMDWGSLAGKFAFTAGQIENALKTAKNYGDWEAASGGIGQEELYRACYAQVRHKLEKKAGLIDPKYNWEDIVLPEEQVVLLKSACNHIRYKHVVYGQWGFDRKLSYGKGLSMLFSGPPGTGKTMAAQVIARELHLELYKIDLSQVVSKYIGETEKNLQEIFREARLSNAILFFDETDALFGKRTEVRDSHDKYANIETSFLLQKMEEYEGITVLATNFMNNIDDAFMRRINFIIKFPFPDPIQREQIWRSIYPREMPLCTDIDYEFLARKFEVAGGNIKNIAVAAAFLAAAAGEPVGMKQLISAARAELQKTGKLLLKEELGEYSNL